MILLKILITGGAGFIGCNLTRHLLERNHQVLVFDNLSTGSIHNIQQYQDNPSFQFIYGNVINYPDLEKLIEQSDLIIHLAASVGVKVIMEETIELIENNLESTKRIIKLCSMHNKLLFFASTSEVYGKSEQMPLKETNDVLYGPSSILRWSYAATKLIDEILSLSYCYFNSSRIIIGRLFNTIGPYQSGRYGMVVPRFVQSALENEPIIVHGDGLQIRTFTDVNDVCRAIIHLTECEKAYGQIVNVSSENSITILDLAKKVKKIVQSKSSIVHIPHHEVYNDKFEDIPIRIPSNEKLKELVGWGPDTPIDATLEAILKWKRGELA